MVLIEQNNDINGRRTAGVKGIAQSIIKDDGTRLNEEEMAAVTAKLRASGYQLVNRLANAVLELNGLGEQTPGERKNGSSEALSGVSATASLQS